MAKFRYEWFLFDYKDGVPDVMSKPFIAVHTLGTCEVHGKNGRPN